MDFLIKFGVLVYKNGTYISYEEELVVIRKEKISSKCFENKWLSIKIN
jgi:hypothetical protein